MELIDIHCEKCGAHLVQAKDGSGDIQQIEFICDCGHSNFYDFIGYPALGTTLTHFFDIVTESQYQCLRK